MRHKTLTLAAVLLALAGTSAAAGADTPGTFSTDPDGAYHINGQTAPVAKVDIPAGIPGMGHGLLAAIFVKEGERVTKGEPLAQMDDALQKDAVALATQLAQSDVELRAQQNQVAYAQNELERIKRVDAGGPVSAEARQKALMLKQSQLGLELKVEEQKQNQLKLQREQLLLDRLTVRSPIDGSVLRINKQPGEETDDNPLITIVQTSRLHAIFFPPRELFGKIKQGDKVLLNIEGIAESRAAVVIAIDPLIDPASQLFRIKMELDNADQKIPAGSSATWICKVPTQTAKAP